MQPILTALNQHSLREKCPNADLFLLSIFLYSDWISVFSPNTGKYGPEITPYLHTFHAVTWVNEHAMNESYCDEVSENLTTFVIVGNARRERSKQRIAFFAVTWFTIC